MPKSYQNYSKVFKRPKKPFEKERLDMELNAVGKYGLQNKREYLTAQYALAKIRKAARELLTLEASDKRRVFEGEALLKRMIRLGVLKPEEGSLDFVLGLKTEQLLERRLQTVVFKRHMANSVHHARVLIRQRHIAVGKQLVNIPSFLVRVASEPHVQHSVSSCIKTGRPGRVAKAKAKNAKKDD
ncbi:unnamed protein product [Moneuplotes crassus]|uniref:Small ribosomal subunit protein uS4 N-terminal domain-containing protein n=1 Tax=Euplotes crassus TaxID=5936 RepID=A0AAD1XXU6_EUPCR|nr:unnamed protein product [Moneuplotes crassus]